MHEIALAELTNVVFPRTIGDLYRSVHDVTDILIASNEITLHASTSNNPRNVP